MMFSNQIFTMLTVALTQTSAKRVLLWNVMVRLAYDVTKAAFWLSALYHNMIKVELSKYAFVGNYILQQSLPRFCISI